MGKRPPIEKSNLVYHHVCFNELGKIQRRAARWAISNDNWSSSVTSMLKLLQWPTLTNHRYTSRLHILYKSIYHLMAEQLPPYFLRTQWSTHPYYPLHFIILSTNCGYYKYSFSPRAIRYWNNLPDDLIESNSLPLFNPSCKQQFDFWLFYSRYQCIIVDA